MGCLESTQKWEPSRVPQHDLDPEELVQKVPKMVIIGDEINRDPSIKSSKVDIYSLQGCKLERTIKLPTSPYDKAMALKHGFVFASHPTRPYLYIAGGYYCNVDTSRKSAHLWQLDLSKDENDINKYRRMQDRPDMLDLFRAIVCRHLNKYYLYTISEMGNVDRLDIEMNRWESAQDLPIPSEQLQGLKAMGDKLYAIGAGQLWSYDSSEVWSQVCASGIPSGHATTAGSHIYLFDSDKNDLNRCDPKTGKIESLPDLDYKAIHGSVSMVGVGNDYLYFTGCHYAEGNEAVMEYRVSKNQVVVAGYLKDKCSTRRAAIILLPALQNGKTNGHKK